jgi:PBP1b-binding outer membrane lipoprotein LpoB
MKKMKQVGIGILGMILVLGGCATAPPVTVRESRAAGFRPGDGQPDAFRSL